MGRRGQEVCSALISCRISSSTAAGITVTVLDADNTRIATQVTGPDGTACLQVPEAGQYTIRATAPSGFNPRSAYIRVLLSPERQYEYTFSFRPVPRDNAVNIILSDANYPDRLLPKGVYQLMSGIFIAAASSDESGRVVFANLPPGNYVYRQLTAPQGYSLDPAEYRVAVAGGALVTERRSNVPVNPGALLIRLNDTNYPAVPVSGGAYDLRVNETVISSGTTDTQGQIAFAELASGEYTVVQTQPPEGYVPDNTAYRVSINSLEQTLLGLTATSQQTGVIEVILQDGNYGQVALPGASFELTKTD